ncbi:MAG: type I glyceraldehyde-3-phosphate dehydrogenase [Planctomycetes bacterium]|nr:type I glyceraldehyde-3-phosphate dehydrogenase [Planctomycetota bacterium]
MAGTVLINGFGRVGRALFRILLARGFRVGRINDPLPAEQLAYLLKYDTVMGRLQEPVTVQDGLLRVGGVSVALSHAETLGAATVAGCDIVVNSSGRNNSRHALQELLKLGARRVVVSKPLASGIADRTLLMGLNHADLRAEDRILSAGSCTAHCFAPVVAALHERWPLLRGYMSTVHAYTSAQNLVDGGHNGDPRRGRAGAANIVPTTTEALVAFEQVLPALRGCIAGMAQRVPVVNGSNVELVLELRGRAEADEVNATLQQAAAGRFRGIVEVSQDPLVSSDIVGNPHSAIVDSLLTHAQPGAQSSLVRVVAWYDNEWGYANRLAELLAALG